MSSRGDSQSDVTRNVTRYRNEGGRPGFLRETGPLTRSNRTFNRRLRRGIAIANDCESDTPASVRGADKSKSDIPPKVYAN